MTSFINLPSVLCLAVTLVFITGIAAQRKAIVITSSVTIKASQERVHDILRQFERFPDWSPFLVSDPEQQYYVGGENGTIGSTFNWEGVAEKTLGHQTLIVADPSYLKMACDIQKPVKANNAFEYHLRSGEEGVVVEQIFTLPANGFSRLMMKTFGVVKDMKTTNELGLSRLKALAEQEELAASNAVSGNTSDK